MNDNVFSERKKVIKIEDLSWKKNYSYLNVSSGCWLCFLSKLFSSFSYHSSLITEDIKKNTTKLQKEVNKKIISARTHTRAQADNDQKAVTDARVKNWQKCVRVLVETLPFPGISHPLTSYKKLSAPHSRDYPVSPNSALGLTWFY